MSLRESLTDESVPTFLHGMTPPLASTSLGEAQVIADKFIARSRNLASDGFIVYDIQDEPSRSGESRPFPFRQLMDSSAYAALVSRSSGKPCVVYKCCDDANFEGWLETATGSHGHDAINVVGRPSADAAPKGPSMREAMALVERSAAAFGCVAIPERHTDEYCASRGKAYAAERHEGDSNSLRRFLDAPVPGARIHLSRPLREMVARPRMSRIEWTTTETGGFKVLTLVLPRYPAEHENMLRKHKAGCEWFISQAVYDAGPTVRLLRDYGALCRAQGLARGRTRVIQRRFNVGALEAVPERNAPTLSVRPER